MDSTIFLMPGKKNKIAGITQNGQKNLIFIMVPKERKKLKLVPLMRGNCSYKNRVSDNSNNSDNDKDNISDNDNNSNMKKA